MNYVDGNGGKVCKKSYPLNASYIRGYGRPKYDTTTVDVPIIEDKEEVETVITTVKVTHEKGLNLRKEANTSSNIIKAFAKGTSLKIYEIKDNWGRTDDGWVCLDYTDYKKTTNSPSNSNSTSKYTTGRYEVTADVLTVRTSPEVKDDNWLRYSQLTSNAQKQVYEKCGYKPNGLCKRCFM